MSSLTPRPPITFRPLAHQDLPVLHRWLNVDHAQHWFGGPTSWDEVVEEYAQHVEGRVPIHSLIVLLEGRAVGWVAWERMDDWPEGKALYGITEAGVANCDVLLGEAEATHRGLGAEVVRRLLEDHIFADASVVSCVIDPFVGNAIAIRAYEKAGFHFWRVAPEDGEGRAAYLMQLRREEFGASLPAPSAWLRPARADELAVAIAIDDSAGGIYADAGLSLDLDPQHPFVQAERLRWSEAAAAQRLLFACRGDGQVVGFSSVDTVDGRPHLDQICVRPETMRQGFGRMLIERALRWSTRERELWLTTYDHLPWNGPWYQRLGFSSVPESEHGPELQRRLAAERAVLPAPEHRVVLRYRHHW